MVRYCRKRSFISLCLWPRSLPLLLEKLPVLLRELRVLSVSQRLSCGLPMAERTGDEETEPLGDEVLPKRRCVVSVTKSSLPLPSHHGQVSLRVSQPSSCSFDGQLARLCWSLQARSSSYHRWRQGCVVTFKPATHMVATCGVRRSGVLMAGWYRRGQEMLGCALSERAE